ncbi:ADP-ribose pyrophosphatase, mitochondrial [Halotydeus destructor]|nr:ADP-ribose pyrophosphatase, mitochondrial [Halotydeus destructor]
MAQAGRSLYCKLGEKLIYRTAVPSDKRLWHIEWPEYKPTELTIDFKDKPWADPDIGSPGFKPKFNEIDGQLNRKSHTGSYEVQDGRPLNPHGRTGVSGKGRLGRWGPNHAVDPVVSRWKRDESGNIIRISEKPILEFVAIKRGDNNQWAIPGGMVDAGEHISASLQREFVEEAMNGLELSEQERAEKEKTISKFFSEKGQEIFRGLVSTDHRNTDNAWMETVVFNYHDDNGSFADDMGTLVAGDDAKDVAWTEAIQGLNLHANHAQFIESIAKKLDAYW